MHDGDFTVPKGSIPGNGRHRAALLFDAISVGPDESSSGRRQGILAYDSDLQLNADGSLDVTERIRVRAEGGHIRRGIYRDFPTHYRDRYGNRFVVDFEMLGLTRNGQPERFFLENKSNGVRINTGNDDFLPVPAEFTYTLRYRTTRQLGFLDTHDEPYFNAIGHGWAFAIESESGGDTLRLPQDVSAAELMAACDTGPKRRTPVRARPKSSRRRANGSRCMA